VVLLLYLALNGLYFYALPIEELASEPILPVAEKAVTALFGSSAAGLLALLLCASIGAATSAMIWAGPRVYAAMAADGLAPRALAVVDNVAPRRAIVLQSAWASVLITTGSFEQLVVYSGVTLAIFSALTVAALIVLRVREPGLPRPFRVPGYPWVPVMYVAASLLIAVYAAYERPGESLLALATVASAVPLYRLVRFSGR